MLGWSQAGWVMPLAAVKARDLAFLIGVSGAGISGAETTIDQARNEMAANGMQPHMIGQIVELMRLQYEFLRTGQGWSRYLATRERIAARLGGNPPEAFPATQDHPYLQFIRPLVLCFRSMACRSSVARLGAQFLTAGYTAAATRARRTRSGRAVDCKVGRPVRVVAVAANTTRRSRIA